ncbi:MAG: glycosyltransferase family 2 protein [Microcystaceae cyanobacterium]
MQTPVVLIIFRRPHTTEKVLNAIRQAKPKQLFVIADAPRPEKVGEQEKYEATLKVIETIDWDCQVYKDYAETNLGSFRRVPTGLNWVFSQVEEAIILEDDCVPEPSFFPFCEELLERYRLDQRVFTISGNNFQFGRRQSSDSYYFSRYHHSWGWATWKRAWQYFDLNMDFWPQVRDQQLLSLLLEDKRAQRYWQKIFQGVFENQIEAWDYRWTFSYWLQNSLHILPSVNLVSNIGFGEDASHTMSPKHPFANLPTQPLSFPLQHPAFMIRDVEADLYSQNTHYDPTFSYRVNRKIKQFWDFLQTR